MKLSSIIYCGDNLEWMQKMPDEFVDLIYADPPFFSNRHYEVIFNDGAEIRSFEDRWKGGIRHYIEWMKDRCFEIHRLLKQTGSLYLHCDWHASHYLKVMLDDVFGPENFVNEVIWYYRGAGVPKKARARRHDVVLAYAKKEGLHYFNPDPIRRPYADTTVERFQHHIGNVRDGKDFGEQSLHPLGKHPDDVITHIQPIAPSAKDRLGYPTQKPEALLGDIILSASAKQDLIIDPFCGCGTTLAVAHQIERNWIGIDVSPTACRLIKRRLEGLNAEDVEIVGLPMNIDELKELKPFEFQNWIIGAMDGVPSKKKVHDMGIDGYTFFDRIPVQVKQSERVGRPVVDDFETALRRHGESALKAAKERKNSHFVLQGIIVAFSFTKGTHEEVARAKGEGIDIQLLTVAEVVKEFEA